MAYHYPSPKEAGVLVPAHLIESRFNEGFHHAITGRQITRVEHLRLSFRVGYRAGKLYLRDLRRQQGILEFPMRARVRFRVAMPLGWS